jgi:hypothetical protein
MNGLIFLGYLHLCSYALVVFKTVLGLLKSNDYPLVSGAPLRISMEKESQASKWKCCGKHCVHGYLAAPARKEYVEDSGPPERT